MRDLPTAIRLLLVDSSPLFRRALAALLNRRRDLRVVGEAGSAAEALARARSLRPDVVVVEPELPDGGPHLVAALAREPPGYAVLALALGHDETTASELLQAGARGYLLRDCEPEDLVRAIQRVHAGELIVAPTVVARVLQDAAGEPARSADSLALTEREREVVGLVARGCTNAQIARALTITGHTVKGHLARILGKLGLENRVQLAIYALHHGLAAPPVDTADSAGGANGR